MRKCNRGVLCRTKLQAELGPRSRLRVSEGLRPDNKKNKQQTPWPLVRERNIPTERPPLVDEIYCQLLWIEGCRVVSAADPLTN
jgi:hypothetical protein